MNRIILLGAAIGVLLVTAIADSAIWARPVRGCRPVNEKRERGKPRVWIPLETLSQALASKRAELDRYMLVIDRACIASLGEMSKLTGITYLAIHNSHIGSLRDMRTLANLKELRLLHVVLADKRVFGYLRRRERHRELHVEIDKVSDLDFLARMTNLEKVTLRLKHHGSLAALAKLTKLRELDLEGQFRDVSFLAGLTQLRRLTIASPRLVDIRGLRSLGALEYLLIQSKRLTDIRPLSSLTRLGELSLVGRSIRDFSPLAAMRGLTNLGLEFTRVTHRTFPWRANWPLIKRISVPNSKVPFGDALPFARFRTLRHLVARPKRLENVEQLRRLLPGIRVDHDQRGTFLRMLRECNSGSKNCTW